METRPEQPPEGRLIHDAADHLDLSIREAAKRAGISYGRWRQITVGYQNVSPGSFAAVHAPAKTLAKMAKVVGITPAQLTDAGRDDAALILAELLRPEPVIASGGITLPRMSVDATAVDDAAADAMESAVAIALTSRRERQIWAELRRALAATPAGAELLSDATQARAWPPASAPLQLTREAIAVLDETPADALLTDPVDNAAIRLVMYPWPDRVAAAAAMRGRLGRPSIAARRAG